MENYNKNHPEKRPGEEFVTNTSLDGFNRITLKTKRIGLVAYTITGVNMKSDNFFPVFASTKEVEKNMKKQSVTEIKDLDVFPRPRKSTTARIMF